jgi:amino acid adenylation domain-containing protein
MSHEHAKVVSKVFCEAIRWILRNPQGTSTDINLLGVEDKTQLLGWNQELPRAMQYCLHEKIAEIALRQPEGSAVHAWDGNLTYKELITEAATLSHRLVELGVSPESMVGLCMDKSKWAIISMLAILQAGGVVVPLGNSHPLTRIDGILGDTKANLILADKQQSDRLAHLTHNPVILTVDEAFQTSLPSKFSAPQIVVTPDNTAWVIFTSGSTGTPKGVLLQHKSLSTSVKAHGEAFGITCETRAAQFAAYTFDVSISDIFATLHHGGCVCSFSEETRMNNLTASLQEFQVNYVNLTPTVMRLLDPADLPLIKTAVVGGEPLDPKLVERWAGQATVINSYGPSECSIISTCYSVSDPAEASIVGFPTATRLWVAETSNPNRLCPIGVPGELLIDGPLLSRGYLNDATKTAASFISNPLFAADLGLPSHLRFYRTGDLVRQNGNGSLTHLGRRDLQVKIRGQRVGQ